MPDQHFLDHFHPERIPPHLFAYTTKVTDTYRWELEVTRHGLFYKDLSDEMQRGKGFITEQGFADFWHYGPLMPMPERAIREKVLGMIRHALHEPDDPGIGAHFPVFDYPQTNGALHWTSGDHVASSFVIVRDHGVDHGAQNWHDGLVFLEFISFEHCLTRPAYAQQQLGKEVWDAIVERLPATPVPVVDALPVSPSVDSLSTELVERSGRGTYFGWLREQRKNTGAADPEVPATPPQPPTARDRQDEAGRLWQAGRREEAAKVLIGLLGEEEDADYWQDYVFNQLFALPESAMVRNFLLSCLHGEQERHFKKAVDVLRMWAYHGDTRLKEQGLLEYLQWSDRRSPAFNEALATLRRILD